MMITQKKFNLAGHLWDGLVYRNGLNSLDPENEQKWTFISLVRDGVKSKVDHAAAHNTIRSRICQYRLNEGDYYCTDHLGMQFKVTLDEDETGVFRPMPTATRTRTIRGSPEAEQYGVLPEQIMLEWLECVELYVRG